MTAIYLRVSNDDGPDRESNTIGNQRNILMQYCKEHDITDTTEYVDDGYSGMLFARPAFQQMMDEVELEKIDTVLVKDLSRFGRNNTLVMYYVDIVFEEHNAKLIAVNDGIDTSQKDDDLGLQIRSILNEMYVKEASKKIRQVFRQKAERGEFFAHAPYGYKKINKRLVIDPATSGNVKRIFELAVNGMVPNQIANLFGLSEGKIRVILKNPAYMGNTVAFRYGTVSLKVQTKVDESEWVIKKDTHEALVDDELFNRVQHVIKSRSRPKKQVEVCGGRFTEMLICGSCGNPLIPQAGGNYGCRQCYHRTISESEIMAEIKEDILTLRESLNTLPWELAATKKDEKLATIELKRLIIQDAPDEDIMNAQKRKREAEDKLSSVKSMLNRARQVEGDLPNDLCEIIDQIVVYRNNVDISYRRVQP